METNALAKKAAQTQNANAAPDKEAQRAANAKVLAPTEVAGNLVNKYKTQIAEALGDPKVAERFVRLVINVIARDPKLIRAVNECPASLIGAILVAAQLGLEPNTPLGEAFLIPYFEKDKVESQRAGRDVWKMRINFQMGVQGVLKLAYRSGDVVSVVAEEVHERDFFKCQQGTDPFLTHIPYDGAEDPGEITKIYAVIRLKSGGALFKVWSCEKILTHAQKFSKSYDAARDRFIGPWADNFFSMGKKTVLLDCLKYAPKSATLAAQLSADNATKSVPASVSAATPVDMLLAPNEENFRNESDADSAPPRAPEIPLKDMGLVKGTQIPAPKRRKNAPAAAPANDGNAESGAADEGEVFTLT